MIKNPDILYPTLYVPATLGIEKITALMNGENADVHRMVIDTEDAVHEDDLPVALAHISMAFDKYRPHRKVGIFLRASSTDVMKRVMDMSGVECLEGFVVPKTDLDPVNGYPAYGDLVNSYSGKDFRVMPILESPGMASPTYRAELREMLEKPSYSQRIDCLRLGINDLMSQQYMRHDNEFTVYETTIGALLGTIVGEFRGNNGFPITAPVFDGYTDAYAELFKKEIRLNIASNLFGQTTIHTKLIPQISDMYKVTQEQFEEAKYVVSDTALAVKGINGRMIEKAVHTPWAEIALLRAELFGIVGETEVGTSDQEAA